MRRLRKWPAQLLYSDRPSGPTIDPVDASADRAPTGKTARNTGASLELIGLNIRVRSRWNLSLRKCRFQLRISAESLSPLLKLRTEVDEELSSAILRSPRPKRVAQKIELLVRVTSFAGHHPCNRHPSSSPDEAPAHIPSTVRLCGPNLLGFRFRPAMHDGIIGERSNGTCEYCFRHPSIKA